MNTDAKTEDNVLSLPTVSKPEVRGLSKKRKKLTHNEYEKAMHNKKTYVEDVSSANGISTLSKIRNNVCINVIFSHFTFGSPKNICTQNLNAYHFF